MAAPVVKLKRSSVPGKVPLTTDIDLGEIAINTFDGKAYFKKDNGTQSIVEIGTGAGGGGSYTAPALLTLYNKNNSGNPATFNGTETRFQLRDSSGNIVTVSDALLAAISVDGVIQKPNSGVPSGSFEGFYVTTNATVGYDIVFGDAPVTGADFFGVLAGTFTATAGTSGIKVLDDISAGFNGTSTAFTLQYNGSNFTPQFPDSVVISVGGVLQVPTDAYTISGSTITFTSAPPSGASFYGLSFEIGSAASFNLVDSVTSTSTTDAATPNSVKTAYNLANAALPKAGGIVTGDVTLNGQSDLRFADADSSNWVGLQAPSVVGSNVTWTLPAADGSAGQLLGTNGSGTLGWTSVDLSAKLDSTTAASTYQTISGMSSYLTTSTASSTYAPLNSPTFTGTVTIPTGASIAGYLPTSSIGTSVQPYSSQLDLIAGLTGTGLVFVSSGSASTRTAPNGNIVGTSDFQTLTNKSLTSPSLASPASTGLVYQNGSVLGNITALGAGVDINTTVGNYFTKTISGNTTFTITNPTASRSYSFILELEHTSGTITWFSGVEWPDKTAPVLTTGNTHLFIFHTDNGGSRWRASSLINYTT